METNYSTSYLTNIFKNIVFFILFFGIYFYNLLQSYPNLHDWTPYILYDYLGAPATLISVGYLFLSFGKNLGLMGGILSSGIIIAIFAYLLDLLIEKLGLPASYWKYFIPILGIILIIYNIVKLIQNIRYYNAFKWGETHYPPTDNDTVRK